MWSLGVPYLEDVHGHGNEALKRFGWICEEGADPNDIS
jgi:hypothetical protein